MMRKLIKFGRIAFLAVVCIVILIPTSLGNNGVEAHLCINDVNDCPESSTGYVTYDSEFTLNITNQDTDEGADKFVLIISLPGYNIEDSPSQSVEITNGTTTTTIGPDDWQWGTPNTSKANGNLYKMPPSDTFPTFFAYYDMGPIGPLNSVDPSYLLSADIKITGGPPVRFDGWGLNWDEENGRWFIVLKNPFSHNLTHVPEFSTIALPIAAIIGIMFILQSRRRKED